MLWCVCVALVLKRWVLFFFTVLPTSFLPAKGGHTLPLSPMILEERQWPGYLCHGPLRPAETWAFVLVLSLDSRVAFVPAHFRDSPPLSRAAL